MSRQYRKPTLAEIATLRRGLELARLTLAHLECAKLALGRMNPQKLRRDISRMMTFLQVGDGDGGGYKAPKGKKGKP